MNDPITLHHGDCLEVLRKLPDASVDSVVTDPPYGISFMGKAWDRPGQLGSQRRNGFQEWCQAWAAECLRITRPGGHLVAFGGSRTWHRLASGIEDAGFEIRDSIAWLFGAGFPKSLNLVDEAGQRTGWGTALKPAFEPIVVARKPLAGTVAANVAAHGAGALNIDACRLATADKLGGGQTTGAVRFSHEGWNRPWMEDEDAVAASAARSKASVATAERLGRWPANVVLDGSQAAELDQQSGVLTSGTMRAGTERQARTGGTIYGADTRNFVPADAYGDSGGASRFFLTADYDEHDIDMVARFYYAAKAGPDERVRVAGVSHPTVKPLALMRWLARLVTPAGGTVLEPFAGSGTTVEASLLEGFRCIAIERETDYMPLIRQRIARRRDPVAAVRGAGEDGGLFDLLDGGVA